MEASAQTIATPLQHQRPKPLHIIHFSCPVTEVSVQNLQDLLLRAVTSDAGAIQLRISSGGGGLNPGFAAYGLLKSLPVPLHTHNSSNVESIAVLMYLAGQRRTAADHSRFTFHPLHWGTGNGIVDHARMAEWVTSLDFDRERYCAIFREATQGAQVPLDIEECLRDRAKIIGAATAATHGITTAALGADGLEASVASMCAGEVHVLPRENVVHWWVNGF